MKKQSIVIQINSFSDLDSSELKELIERKLPIGVFISSIKFIGIDENTIIEYSKLHQKKNKNFKEAIVHNGYAHIFFTYQIY